MRDGAVRDICAQSLDMPDDGPGVRPLQSVQRFLADEVQFGVVAAHQFDQDGVLGIEVVVETALQQARRVRDLAH